MVRRVVTSNGPDGQSVIAHDSDVSGVRYEHTAGFAHALIWTTTASGSPEPEAPREPLVSYVPAPGETVAMTVTFPPDSVFMDPGFDPAAAVSENLRNLPGLAEQFEPDAPGMHTTPTIDYVVVLDGALVLEVDGGTTTLSAGDVVVQNGTRHAWRVPGDRPATIFVVLMGHSS